MNNFISHKAEKDRALEHAIDVGMEAVAQEGEANAIREVTKLVYDTPPSPTYVRTGDLRKSLSHKYVKEEKAAYIGTNLEYAPYVEYGNQYVKERPYLRNAGRKYSREYNRIINDALSKLS